VFLCFKYADTLFQPQNRTRHAGLGSDTRVFQSQLQKALTVQHSEKTLLPKNTGSQEGKLLRNAVQKPAPTPTESNPLRVWASYRTAFDLLIVSLLFVFSTYSMLSFSKGSMRSFGSNLAMECIQFTHSMANTVPK